ncbi:MAG TPA: Gfo/Idh/MocA family oxidoreductase [Clostridiaceae bacterium]|nr:Gfo/Idh/MocA family oxidoreductase [Clostridiaceae bacterium]
MNNRMPLKIALAGCGRVADKHLKALNYLTNNNKKHGQRAELIALIDPVPQARQRILSGYGFSRDNIQEYDCLEDMFETNVNDSHMKPDIVAITTPSSQHYTQAKQALENDCHVFIEKPIAMQLEHAQELRLLAEQNYKKIVVGHIYRYFPVIGLVAQDIAQGMFGKPLYGTVSVRWGHDQTYYDQATWRGTREHDGGAIMNQSIHALDLMHWLLGEPELISAKGAISTQIHRIESEDLGFGIFEFADDRWLMLEGTTNTEPARPEASFFVRLTQGDVKAGISSGRISFSVFDSNGKQLKNRYIRREIFRRIKTEGFSYLLQMGNPHTAIYIDLIDSISNDRQPLADVVSGINSLKLVLALYQDAGVSYNH